MKNATASKPPVIKKSRRLRTILIAFLFLALICAAIAFP